MFVLTIICVCRSDVNDQSIQLRSGVLTLLALLALLTLLALLADQITLPTSKSLSGHEHNSQHANRVGEVGEYYK